MEEEQQPSRLASGLSVVIVLVIAVALAGWKHERSTDIQNLSADAGFHHRSLEADMPVSIDDDATRDDVCKEYLMNFLNGTTDSKDECNGMLNAYQAADCVDDSNILHPQQHHKRKHKNSNYSADDDLFNPNATHDDLLIDDYFEAWECCSSIYRYYNAHCRQAQLASLKLLGIMGVLIACGLFKSMIRTFNVEWIPDAAVCILLGAVVGGILKLISDEYVNEKFSFDNDLFLNILLPPIIFASALSIDKGAFRRDLFPILTFAIIGTVFSAVLIGIITNFLTSLGRGTTLPLLDSLLFGSLISSIDPVATLSILSGVGIGQTDTLYTLIFGEALLNDGAAVVLFDTLLDSLSSSAKVDGEMMRHTFYSFMWCAIGAIFIGIGCGVICTLYFWALRKRHSPVVETGIFFCFALVPFYISDGVGFSGIISIMTMGFFLDYFVIGGSQSDEAQWMAYVANHSLNTIQMPSGLDVAAVLRAFSGHGHLSTRSRHHIGFVAEVIASIMETAIFAYLGLFLFNDEHFWDIRIKATAIFGCVVSRAVMILVLSLVINFFVWLDFENRMVRLLCPNQLSDDELETNDSYGSRARVYLSQSIQKILLLAGVRGAVSFALVENIPVYDAVRKRGSLYKPELRSMTAASILFTVFVFGPLTYYVVKKEQGQHGGSPLAERLLSDPLCSDDEDGGSGGNLSDLELSSTPPNTA